MRRYLLLACAVSVVTAAAPRPLVKFGLLDVAFGPTTRLLTGDTPPAIVPFAVADVAVGAMVSDRIGVGLGTAILDGSFMSDISSFPLRGYLFYDFSPAQRWHRLVGFLTATYVHSGRDGWSGSGLGPYLKLAGGASYTWYAVTPHAEVGYDWSERFVTLTAGIAIGGTYILR